MKKAARRTREEVGLVSDRPEDPTVSGADGHAAHGRFYDPAVHAVAEAAARITIADRKLVARARSQPLAATALALVAGYLLGRLLSRRG